MLTKMTVEPALNAELDEHLDYKKHSPTNITDDGEIQLEISRDRDAGSVASILQLFSKLALKAQCFLF